MVESHEGGGDTGGLEPKDQEEAFIGGFKLSLG